MAFYSDHGLVFSCCATSILFENLKNKMTTTALEKVEEQTKTFNHCMNVEQNVFVISKTNLSITQWRRAVSKVEQIYDKIIWQRFLALVRDRLKLR